MLLKLTTRCNIECKHCLSECNSEGVDISWYHLNKSVTILNRFMVHILVISGGEPTLHPDFLDMVKYICMNCSLIKNIVITTNGIIFEENYLLAKELIDFDQRIFIDVTCDSRYYPNHVDLTNPLYCLERVRFYDSIVAMYPQGRALKNGYPHRCVGSKCVNCISIPRQLNSPSFQETINLLESHQKYCTPQIDADGSMKPGESCLCKSFGTVEDDDDSLLKNLLSFRCTQCDFININLPNQLRRIMNIENK